MVESEKMNGGEREELNGREREELKGGGREDERWRVRRTERQPEAESKRERVRACEEEALCCRIPDSLLFRPASHSRLASPSPPMFYEGRPQKKTREKYVCKRLAIWG
jgi:hypothetical protein